VGGIVRAPRGSTIYEGTSEVPRMICGGTSGSAQNKQKVAARLAVHVGAGISASRLASR